MSQGCRLFCFLLSDILLMNISYSDIDLFVFCASLSWRCCIEKNIMLLKEQQFINSISVDLIFCGEIKMKKCIIYGNCQRGLLERYLLKSNFVKYYQIIPTVPVQCKNKQNLDAEILSSVDLIIYQNVSDTFGHEFSSQAILSQLKPSCEKILFPSMYFNAYWPQATKQPVVRRLRDLNTTPGGLFPHGDSNIIRLMQSGTSLEKIINIVSDEDFYSESDVMESINKSFYELNKREKENNVDIAVSDYIYNNLKNRYLMHTINHPTCFVGVYVVRQILDILGIEHEDFESQYMTNEHRLSTLTKYDFELPIYPSVIRWLNLSFVDKIIDISFTMKTGCRLKDMSITIINIL